MFRVFLLDDHEVVRRGLRAILETDAELRVVGEAADVAHAFAAIDRCAPHVAVLDLHMTDGTGLDVCRRLAATRPDVQCVILASTVDDADLVAAHDAGAAAVLRKDAPVASLVDAIGAVASGRRLLDDAQARLARRRFRDSEVGHVAALTPQEYQVFELIGHGRTNREIAAQMRISDKTVKNYVSNLLAKLGVHRRAEAAAIAGRLDERRPSLNGAI